MVDRLAGPPRTVSTHGFLGRLRSGPPVLLDGPVGTELDRRGVDTHLPLWSARALVSAPEVVRRIHEDHLAAGAEVLTANTFRTHRRSLAKGGLGERAAELTALAVALAREAIAAVAPERPIWVAGSIAPLEDCYSPELTPPDEALRAEHAEIAAHLEAAGVDLIEVETMPTVREAAVATAAASRTGLPVLVGFTCGRDGRLLSGESLAAAARTLEPLRPSALMINCTPYDAVEPALRELRAATGLPLGAYGNVGHAESERGWDATQVATPAEYAACAHRWLELGVRLVGCCCGTRPEHLAAVADLLQREP